ncbi:MAG: hypothetical protein QOE27_654 [Solirubrobacteraceae bacterium]|jgi:hypothetical protein|nr:hypothetical protein [Solirubrobacteraceae bacterium]
MSLDKLRTLTFSGVLVVVLGATTLAAATADAAASRLSLTRTVRPATNGTTILRVQAANRGARAIRSVRVTNALPAGAQLSSASAGCGRTGASAVTCNLGTIAGHSAKAVTIVLRPVGAGTGLGTIGASSGTPGSGAIPGAGIPSAGGAATLSSPSIAGTVTSSRALALPACTRTITGSFAGTVVVAPGETVCIVNAHVFGGVIVQGGGGLSISNSEIDGSITSNGATFVSICGPTASPYIPTTVTAAGTITIVDTTGPVTIGGPPGSGCSPNQIGGGVTLRSNRGGTTLFGNTIGAGVLARSNINGLLIGGNNIGGNLSCFTNVPPPTNGGVPNTYGLGTGTGQCAGL